MSRNLATIFFKTDGRPDKHVLLTSVCVCGERAFFWHHVATDGLKRKWIFLSHAVVPISEFTAFGLSAFPAAMQPDACYKRGKDYVIEPC